MPENMVYFIQLYIPKVSKIFVPFKANSTGAIVKNLASNVNLSHYMDLWTLLLLLLLLSQFYIAPVSI